MKSKVAKTSSIYVNSLLQLETVEFCIWFKTNCIINRACLDFHFYDSAVSVQCFPSVRF